MKTPICTAALLALMSAPLSAGTLLGLSGDRTLVMIDPTTAMVTGTVEVQSDIALLGIDYRSPNMSIIGVTEDFRVITIDPMTGMTESLVQMDKQLPIDDGAAVIVDINPAADALRFMSGTVNHRVNLTTGAVMTDGELHFADSDMMPMVVATGYVNNLRQPESTAMYNIDAEMMALLRQAPPNDGTNMAVGMLGVNADGPLAFDVGTDANGVNTAWLSTGMMLHLVDLDTGAATGSWPVTGLDMPLRDLTVLP